MFGLKLADPYNRRKVAALNALKRADPLGGQPFSRVSVRRKRPPHDAAGCLLRASRICGALTPHSHSGAGSRVDCRSKGMPRCPLPTASKCHFFLGGPLREAAHLSLNKAAIDTFVAHQLVWRAVLNDLSGLQHYNAVKISDSREAMCDRDHGAPAHEAPKSLLNGFL